MRHKVINRSVLGETDVEEAQKGEIIDLIDIGRKRIIFILREGQYLCGKMEIGDKTEHITIITPKGIKRTGVNIIVDKNVNIKVKNTQGPVTIGGGNNVYINGAVGAVGVHSGTGKNKFNNIDLESI